MSTPFSHTSRGSVHSNRCISEPSMACTILVASGSPRQTRRPALNGMKSNSVVPKKPVPASSCCSRNLSGMNLSGSGHAPASRCTAQRFTSTVQPLGTAWPWISTVSSASFGTSGTTGCSRSVSLMTAWR
uniref:Uncharacterized protein n=1 Tax=Arundo donax TaxID=35708 RepID=A0A0A8YLH7_ARUDO